MYMFASVHKSAWGWEENDAYLLRHMCKEGMTIRQGSAQTFKEDGMRKLAKRENG
ncbi:hypothetical protein KI387_013649, partial [Taxus chinensis]